MYKKNKFHDIIICVVVVVLVSIIKSFVPFTNIINLPKIIETNQTRQGWVSIIDTQLIDDGNCNKRLCIGPLLGACVVSVGRDSMQTTSCS